MSENAKEMIDFLVKEGIIKVRIDDIWGANDLIYVYEDAGQTTGPRMGSFIELFGVENTRDLIRRALGQDGGARAVAQ